MNKALITFFMIVTDPDIILADYAVKSYRMIRGVPFKLRIFSNWVSTALKRQYFDSWRRYPFVEILSNDWQDDQAKPQDRTKLEGPFEMGATIWDRELKLIKTPYFATVDADFEILDPRFIPVMLSRLQTDPNLCAISTDYGAKDPRYYDSYSNEVICLNERWGTWFCIYKREAMKSNVSHFYYEEIVPGPVPRNAWDSSGYLQKSLKDEFGYKLEVLDRKYQPCFIHYSAFSKNRNINSHSIRVYRALSILRKRGFLGRGDRLGRLIGRTLVDLAFPRSARATYLPGWVGRPGSCSTRDDNEAARG